MTTPRHPAEPPADAESWRERAERAEAALDEAAAGWRATFAGWHAERNVIQSKCDALLAERDALLAENLALRASAARLRAALEVAVRWCPTCRGEGRKDVWDRAPAGWGAVIVAGRVDCPECRRARDTLAATEPEAEG